VRILGVRFKNLNSLVGEWHVDFTHPAYSSDGIFAITGPTGAGKTTILDAICIGLYGRTPRLDKVTKSSNEIMSRQTGECFAEVTFETQKGRYRCHWSQHRARRRPDGELQQARHEIADADSGTVLESRLAQVGEAVEAATGMDFERFTRSMLLAQGGFAAFLQAPPDERAPILEQITGTKIYSSISMKVHERRTEERDKLQLLQAELKGIQVLDPDEERGLQTSLEEKQSRETELAIRVEDLRKAALWLDRVAALEMETTELDKKLQEIEKSRQAFAPEAKKLELARKALSLEGDYRGVAALRAQQAGETKELDCAVAVLPERQKTCDKTLALKQAAETRLVEARAWQQAEGEVIKKVRDVDTRLGETKKYREEKDRAIAEAERQGKAYQSQIADLDRELKQALADREAVHDYLAKRAGDAALPATIAVITRGFTAIRDLEGRQVKAHEALAEVARNRKSAAEAFKKIETDHEKIRRELDTGQSALKGLTEEINAILKDRDIDEWRRQIDTLKDRERLLSKTGETIAWMDKNSRALDDLKRGLETLKATYAKLMGEITSASDQKALLEKNCGTLESEVSLLNRIRKLEEERQRLEDGKPCPLCGATDHPYAEGNVPELGKAETALKNARAELNNLSETLGKLKNEEAKTSVEIAHTEKETKAKKAELDVGEKECTDALLRLNIDAVPEERAGKIREALEGVQAKIAETAGIVAAAEEKTKAEKAAQTALERLRVQYESSGKALQDASHKLETAGGDHQRLIKESETLEEEARKARAAALKDVEPFGIGQLPSIDLDAILNDLTERKETWQAKLGEKTAHEKKSDELKAERDKTCTLLESLERDLAARRRDRDNLIAQCGSLMVSRRELFGEKDADREEKRLADAVNHAEKALEKAREEYGNVEKEIGALNEKIASLKEKTGNRAIRLIQEEQKLAERVGKAGFADEAEYLASSLSEEERDILAEKENFLIKERTELGARRKDRSEVLEAERLRQVTDLPRETLRERINAGDADLKAIRLDIGGITKGLTENTKMKEKQQERLKHSDAQKKECERWDLLHELIGSADGKKFRNFAQGLTFEMMTMHANRQLEKMTDRYLLIRDSSEPLELNVIDNYQAGEIRSTKNLSGGESFIVSLALALGLAHMASRNVRIDSLFLDEGFGTLDEDALETALETLAGLQQDGKLIGVISHVAALKERIGTQIQVIPQTGGHSGINGPGCRRI
jgi:exonuclease SbcC